ncbi:hypothetical protein UFOVP1351_35 [uncultured Caudovirales phage]|uniref:Uncharacterized protein n=1 Tax=uncultured Caudovirales phage TaxID=2100421 RepID=A0A6J5S069_9CAUD|nr:hypothetical protein UFOVP1351_35 [uncultured Caudovirales phage]
MTQPNWKWQLSEVDPEFRLPPPPKPEVGEFNYEYVVRVYQWLVEVDALLKKSGIAKHV